MALQVRERPPLRLSIDAHPPSGSRARWGQDEPKAVNVPSDLTFTTSMPGGFETLGCTLPRKPEREYSDLARFTDLRVLGPGGAVAWEGRLESSPRVSGDQMAVSPGAVGWQAHLEDDKSASMIYIDRDLNSWGETSRAIRLSRYSAYAVTSSSLTPDQSTGMPGIAMELDGDWTASRPPFCETEYDAGSSNLISSIYFDWQRNTDLTASDWRWELVAASTDDPATWSTNTSGDLQNEPNATGSNLFTPASPRRFAFAEFYYNTAASNTEPGRIYAMYWRQLHVIGNHGISPRGTAPDWGFYASDVVAHAVRTWAPLLALSTGSSGSVTDSSFIIPQLAFKDPTTAADIIQGANRYHLRDWAVWEDKTFYYHDRGARGRSWRARVGPAQLSETGPSIENLWNGVIVKYQDVDGTTKTVGPTGSGCDTTSTDCEDLDPLNPANELGIRRWTQIDMGGVSTAAGATEVGRRFLIEAAQYNASGQAQLVGHVEDDRGVLHPTWRVRAGDTITFVDAASTTPRRIVKTSYSHASRTNSIDLDAPPEGLDSLLARLQVVLAPLGL